MQKNWWWILILREDSKGQEGKPTVVEEPQMGNSITFDLSLFPHQVCNQTLGGQYSPGIKQYTSTDLMVPNIETWWDWHDF